MAIFLSLRCKTLHVVWRATPRWTTSARCDWVFPLTKHCSATRLVSLLRLPHNPQRALSGFFSPPTSSQELFQFHQCFGLSRQQLGTATPAGSPHTVRGLGCMGFACPSGPFSAARPWHGSSVFSGIACFCRTESSLIASRAFQEKAELCELARVSVSSAAT